MLKKTNVEEKLRAYRNRINAERNILQQVQFILQKEQQKEDQITAELTGGQDDSFNDFVISKLDMDRVYHLDQIKTICIDYRLRFLSTRYFKGKIPAEALIEIKSLEKQHNTQLKGFKIIAPSKLFKLENADDPLLMAPIGNGYYYLIHKWGNDLHPMRRLLVLPFRNLMNLTLTILMVSYLLTMLMPMGLFTNQDDSASFWLLFMFMFKMIGSIVIFYGFALGKNFNTAIWNSKYFNA
ncbi:hypothetical protein E7Z59_09995 [Robertkochia marina]|uniref:Uncharacterized protein n=1 Tax=Robertkochia marina TaxID=1227945 RepID=A0A4S3M2X3_9FLAO|nr:hypothetical protein [Robertkochia marina]THD67969.1 hypothetical protein E7Z59_09995 [Robertkochia marina]TRZ41533.1 hypothetical protein D3A96_13115 [Robertkochia marina]